MNAPTLVAIATASWRSSPRSNRKGQVVEFVFWLSLVLLVYIYVGYPAVVAFLASRPRVVGKDSAFLPAVSILVPAYNEAVYIEPTLRNKLELDYPAGRLEIRVVSDASDDGTDEIVQRVAAGSSVPVLLYRQEPRRGKTAGINALARRGTGEILAFADANSIWAPDALRRLVANFADEDVGYVTGKMVYTQADGSVVGGGCSRYMRFENWLRERETAIGSIVGVDGGIDAMRGSLYRPLRDDQLPDFVQPLLVVEQGRRVVYEPSAILKEPVLDESSGEFAMRVRVTLRALWALKDMAHLMNPLRYGRFAWQLISHKLLRYLAFVPLVTLLVAHVALLTDSAFYALTGVAHAGFYLLAYLGHRRAQPSGEVPFWVAVPYYFVLLNVACAVAAAAFLRGERRALWVPRKG
jgi:glycosyltransferase involved in cell wall biosynthesis